MKKDGSDHEVSSTTTCTGPHSFYYLLLFKPDFITTNPCSQVTNTPRKEFSKRMTTSTILPVYFTSVLGSGRNNNISNSHRYRAP